MSPQNSCYNLVTKPVGSTAPLKKKQADHITVAGPNNCQDARRRRPVECEELLAALPSSATRNFMVSTDIDVKPGISFNPIADKISSLCSANNEFAALNSDGRAAVAHRKVHDLPLHSKLPHPDAGAQP